MNKMSRLWQFRECLRWPAVLIAGIGVSTALWAQSPPGIRGTTPFVRPMIASESGGPSKTATEGFAAVVMQDQKPPLADYAPPGVQPREVQDAPGAVDYRKYSPIFPDYVYQPSYYDTPGIGARPLADYAPPGYEPREIQEAPGVPEFTKIYAPPRVSADERQKFVTGGLFPGSYLAPGTNTSFRFRGFVRVGGTYDFNPIGSRDDFVTNTIPVPQTPGQNQNISARFSRLALDTWTPTSFNDWNVHTLIEGDFFNGPGQAVGGGGNPFRLRFAFIDFGYFRVGQQNSVFQDSSAFPMTADFAGPRGLINLRRPTARVTVPLCDRLYMAAAIEQPFSDITTNGLGTNVQDVPDFASHLRYEADVGHVQVSSLVRSIGYRPTGGAATRQGGWGVNASTVFHPWALLMGVDPVHTENPDGWVRSRALFQYAFGWGIGRYIQDTAALGLDGQVDPSNGRFDTLYAVGWSASYENWFNDKWLSNITYSEDYANSSSGQAGSTYAGAKYLAASVWWIPIPRMSLGVEYLWGQRDNIDDQHGIARRVQTVFQYNF